MDQAAGGEAVMKVRMKVEGGDKIARKLQMMAEEVARTHMRECALAGAEVIRAEAATLAPRKTGTLAGDIQKEVKKQTKSRVDVHIGPGKEGWYGRLVEDGHAIVVAGKKVGDVPPHPFMRPAFDAKTGEAYDAFEAELKRRLGL
ncbi:MAG TPA: HK97 gp10 family phage protein [Bacillota bacterium]|nr:HK97 gp10 family phage protein [Bacillota bacterium]